ncbi:MAG TPA: terminase gpA endonuclease subunit [Candidatus Binatia bacterium]|nr:terminase gpA endonuclease subunit [Candidatus Binatia bacterium]
MNRSVKSSGSFRGTNPIARMHQTRNDLEVFLRQSRPRLTRSMRVFAEEEIIIPDGPFVGRKFLCSRQPFTGLWFNAVDSGRWNRCVATGPTQSGKTLSAFIVPLLFHLFELQETVICGLPDMDMASDKWREDVLPVIERSRYRELLPKRGAGSRGGKVESVQFGNGATLKFMSGGGSDKSRAGFTSRVVVITETDGMDQPAGTSRESDKITQLEARTRAYGNRKRVYMECTVSTEEGRTWKEYSAGTRSRIVLHCPLCRAWVSPEREHLIGWQGVATQAEARKAGAFFCPACNRPWTEIERTQANLDAQTIHGDQLVDADGGIVTPLPETETLGFRWSAVNNLFLTAGDIASDEWRASRSRDEENSEREMRQFVWCIPVASSKSAETALEATELASRMTDVPRGVVPADTEYLTAGVDLGKFLNHWIIVAWRPGATGHVVDYGRTEVASGHLGVEQAVMIALREFQEIVQHGWPVGKPDGEAMIPAQVWIDSGYSTSAVYAFCRQSGTRFRPAIGRGMAQQHRQWYNRPLRTGAVVKRIGDGYHVNRIQTEQLDLVEVNSDHWKTWIHQRLSTPLDALGAMTLFHAGPHEHLTLVKHLTAETKVEEFIAGQGVVVKWERLRRQNHWFDALYNACAAGHFCGARLIEEGRHLQRRVVSLAEAMGRA